MKQTTSFEEKVSKVNPYEGISKAEALRKIYNWNKTGDITLGQFIRLIEIVEGK